MTDLVKFFPLFYLVPIVFLYIFACYFYQPKQVSLVVLGFLYFSWSVVLGVRNVYDDPDFDPGIFYYQAKTLTITDLWEYNFPRVDILLQVIMRAYYKFCEDDVYTLIFTEVTIIGLLFVGLLVLTKANSNALIIGLSFLVFTNTGILLTGNFLRQGLAAVVFLNIFCFVTSGRYDYTAKITDFKLFFFFFVGLFQFFSHISSTLLLIYLFIANLFKKRDFHKVKFWFSITSIMVLALLINSVLSSGVSEVYGVYATVNYDEGPGKLIIKLAIDSLAIVSLFLAKRCLLKGKGEAFNLAIKTCIIIFLVCCFYSYAPIIALRLEYYLSFLIIITLSLFISYFPLTTTVARITTLLSVLAMYSYSFTVYEHPSIIRMFTY